jgi:hypothetical protein
MQLTVSINKTEGENQSDLSSNWNSKTYEILNETDARKLFCQCHYSPNIWDNGQRKSVNFRQANFIVIDFDEGIAINEAKARFAKYQHIIVTSRNHGKAKGGKVEDRFHAIFPIENPITDPGKLKRLRLATIFTGCDSAVFDPARFFYKSPKDAIISVNPRGLFLNIDDLDYFSGLIDLSQVKSQKQVYYCYPEKVIDTFSREMPISELEARAIKASDIAKGIVPQSSVKFYCPLGDDCPSGGHNSASSYLVQMPNDTYIIKDFKHPDSVIWKRDPLEVRAEHWYRVGSKFNEVVMLPDVGDIRLTHRGIEDVKTRLGADAIPFIIKEKSLPEPFDWDFIGGGSKDLTYVSSPNGFTAYCPLPPAGLQDNSFIEIVLESWFGQHLVFIKDWIAYYTFTNFQHLPIMILTGERGTGKSLFADFVGMIYEHLTGRFDTATVYTEHAGLKLAIIEEADEYDNVKLYSVLKDVGGSEKLIRNIKYGPKTLVKNNLNVIVISNNVIPLYLKAKEKPVDENNNQFFVYRFPLVKGKLDNSLKEKLRDRIGYWLRTEIKNRFETLETRADKWQCRYQIPVPITEAEKNLFDNNRTEIEIVLEEFLDELKTPYIIADDLRALSWKHDLKLHSIKRRLIEMGAVESNKSNANGRNLVGIDGRVHHKVRKYELTAKYRNKKNERTSIIK